MKISPASFFKGLGLALIFGALLYIPRTGASLEWVQQNAPAAISEVVEPVVPSEPLVTHLETPRAVRALYMSSWVAGTPTMRDHVIKLIDETEANAVVIDIKDYSGRVSYSVDDPMLKAIGSEEHRIKDIKELIRLLHEKNIYVIGRVAVFQDAFLSESRPDLALRKQDTDKTWKDRKGIAWLDAGSKEVWEYVSLIGRDAWKQGFDEINYDYIRFPSDGDTNAIGYRFYDPLAMERHEQIRAFFAYLDDSLSDIPLPLSADLFGMTTSNKDDLGIGQVLEDAMPYFDYIAPMIYPSHYPANWNNIKNPDGSPYLVIKLAMEPAIARAETASSTKAIFRPWLQDFSLGVKYTAELIKDQKRALDELGIEGWMMWDPSNKYTRGGLE